MKTRKRLARTAQRTRSGARELARAGRDLERLSPRDLDEAALTRLEGELKRVRERERTLTSQLERLRAAVVTPMAIAAAAGDADDLAPANAASRPLVTIGRVQPPRVRRTHDAAQSLAAEIAEATRQA